jgi:hypothetical protein
LVEAAADRLGITLNAVRQRLKRGTLAGHKTPAGWVVVLPTDHPTIPDHGRSSTDRPPAGSRPATDRPRDQLDVAPLADLIADLTRENRRLAETAATLAERNRVLTERLLALESGPLPNEWAATKAPATHSEAPGATEPAEMEVFVPATRSTTMVAALVWSVTEDRPAWYVAVGETLTRERTELVVAAFRDEAVRPLRAY